MKCPICEGELKRIIYGGVPIFRCFGCAGYLVQEKRFGAVARSEDAPIDLLKQEVVNESKPDTTKKIKCPRCHCLMMKLKIDSPASLTIDVCSDSKCGHLWLDGGELARLQLATKVLGTAKSECLQIRINNLRGEAPGTRLNKLPANPYYRHLDDIVGLQALLPQIYRVMFSRLTSFGDFQTQRVISDY